MSTEMHIWMALRSVLFEEVSLIAKVDQVTHFGEPRGTYITASNTTAQPERVLLKSGQPHIYRGFLNLSLVSPIGEVPEVYLERAIRIASCFPEGRKLRYLSACVEIANHPHVQEGYRDGGDWRVPITITWRAFA